MFANAYSFDQNLDTWNIGQVTEIGNMFFWDRNNYPPKLAISVCTKRNIHASFEAQVPSVWPGSNYGTESSDGKAPYVEDWGKGELCTPPSPPYPPGEAPPPPERLQVWREECLPSSLAQQQGDGEGRQRLQPKIDEAWPWDEEGEVAE